jgi:hypothetical protein
MLLKEWFVRLIDPGAARRTPVEHPRGGYWKLFGPGPGKWDLADGLLASLRWSSRFRRVRRVAAREVHDFRLRVSLHETPDGWIDRVQRAARRRGQTLNDLFLAAIAEACDRYAPLVRTSRRQDLVLGSIVDLRQDAREDLSNTFGLFL